MFCPRTPRIIEHDSLDYFFALRATRRSRQRRSEVHPTIYAPVCLSTRFDHYELTKTSDFSVEVDSESHFVDVQQKLSNINHWTIFFRTQGNQTVTPAKIRGLSDDLCARLLIYKNPLFGSLKMSAFCLFFQGID